MKAQYCIKTRKNTGDIKFFKCDGCYKNFTSKQTLQLHSLKCKSNELNSYKQENKTLKKMYDDKIIFLETQINQKDDIIQDLQNKLENIAISAVSRPTTSNKTQINNYIQQLQPVTEEHLIDNVQHLTIDHIMKGPEGYAQYALEYPLKDRLICVDYARRKVKFKNKDGKVITDPEMSNLATKFFNSIKDKNKELIIECGKKLKENFGDELDTIVKIFDYKSGVERGSDGERSEFHHDFVKQVCSQTIKE
tara:strand:- start:70 stop:819 length:750 start_codon:yes stop_codon:yes gene_type:complete